jgi:hypothetical protein
VHTPTSSHLLYTLSPAAHSPNATCACTPLQILQILSNPSHPDLVPKLRFAATNINVNNVRDLHLWLKGGLFTRLLGILEALPSLQLTPAKAADVCASAVAVLSNVILLSMMQEAANLPPAATPQMLFAEAGSLDILATVARFGMTGAAALEPLAGPRVHVQKLEQLLEYYKPRINTGQLTDPSGRKPPARTPLQVCGYLIMELLMLDEAIVGKPGALEAAANRLSPMMRPLVDTAILRHLMETAMEDPGGTCPCSVEPCSELPSVHVQGTYCKW